MFYEPVNGSLVPFMSQSYAFNQSIVKGTEHSGFFATFVLLVGVPGFKQRLELVVHPGKFLQATDQPLRPAWDYVSCPTCLAVATTYPAPLEETRELDIRGPPLTTA